jgi:hypothetical protein
MVSKCAPQYTSDKKAKFKMAQYCLRVQERDSTAPNVISPIITKRFISALLRAKGAKLTSMLTPSRRFPMIVILETFDIRALSRVFWALGELGNVRIEIERL